MRICIDNIVFLLLIFYQFDLLATDIGFKRREEEIFFFLPYFNHHFKALFLNTVTFWDAES